MLEIMRQIDKLQDEGYLKFTSRSEVVNFLENDMNYIVFEGGKITKYTSCRLACGKTWNQVKNLKPKDNPSDLDKAYFIENNLNLTWFNYTCWKRLGIIFLTKADYKAYKCQDKK